MERHPLRVVSASLLCVIAGSAGAAPPPKPSFNWTTVVNNNDPMPGDSKGRTFNSYNQPSVNVNGVVVLRARSRGGEGQGPGSGMPTHGIYTRDMSIAGSSIIRILDRTAMVPQPNNCEYPGPQGQGTTLTRFVETPSFPRIDMWSDTIATRGNHQPVWNYSVGSQETRVGTTGIYTNPFGDLITGASKLGAVAEYAYFAVPGLATAFDVFPGSPAVTGTGGDTIVFKGNYTVGTEGKTGVFFRTLYESSVNDGAGGGTGPVTLIANNTVTLIPGTDVVFGSTSPPSAADGNVVFAGFDNENSPSVGGIYLAPVAETPELTALVKIGDRVPGESVRSTFNRLGEGTAYDGRYVGFWGAWGTETATVRLYCPTEGNKDRIAYCNHALQCADGSGLKSDENTDYENETGLYYQDVAVSVNQGIFVHDTLRNRTYQVAKTGSKFDDFQYWTYSGRTPCVGSSGHGEEGAEDDGEFVRWRSSAFVAVSGIYAAFKATGRNVTGIYLGDLENQSYSTVLDTSMDGQTVDPLAPVGSTITDLGLEREGLRGRWLAISAKMGVTGGTEEDGMAGIYLTTILKK